MLCLAQAQEWNYDDATGFGPSFWADSYPSCGGARQSPVNIATDSLGSTNLGQLSLTNYDLAPGYRFNMTNLGHGVQINVPNTAYRIAGNGLRGPYTMEQFHVHWGHADDKGSEHFVDGNGYAMEIHMVHYDATRYSGVAAALSDPQGVVVVAIFVAVDDASPTLSQALGSVATGASEITIPGDVTSVTSFALQNLLPSNLEYFRYLGSLTTPPCSESVVWTIFKNPLYITQAEMDQFRAIHATDGELMENFRPLQSLNSRQVSTGF